jgi:hypothetical protein
VLIFNEVLADYALKAVPIGLLIIEKKGLLGTGE